MIKIKKFVFNPFQENTWLVYDDTNEAIIIDAGCYSQNEVDKIVGFVKDENIKVKYLINTHCHIDHILGVNVLKDIFKVDFLAHSFDIPLLESSSEHAMLFGLTFDNAPKIDNTLNDDERVDFGKSYLKVIHTPGHTLGGTCLFFHEEKILFSGDTLFNGSIGRTDLQGGNFESIIKSIKTKILTLPNDVTVYSGHGESTTIGEEKIHNPFLVK